MRMLHKAPTASCCRASVMVDPASPVFTTFPASSRAVHTTVPQLILLRQAKLLVPYRVSSYLLPKPITHNILA